ncbi:MAG: SpoVR family protein, partial [Planctomycetota bacterium]|nr:SpoVR family protein [Planctomycetota bacterium]
MPFSTHRPLPDVIRRAQDELWEIACGYGLDCFETIFEMVDYEEMSMLASYGGFPTRYPHWRFGAEYDEMMKSYSYGLSKIYEMVINTDPCYAYLLDANELADQKLVIAHVYGHCDFFKNNAWFSKTNRRMLDQMANHASRINRYVDRVGYEAVEQFIDACLSLDDLIDPHSAFVAAKERPHAAMNEEPDAIPVRKFDAKGYMDEFINPRQVIEDERKRRTDERQQKEESRSFPEEPQRDVLLFLLEHAPLKDWQHDILSIIRDEAYYYAPQGQTKIMNEGWASYWHSTLMTKHFVEAKEVIDYADHHSGTVHMPPGNFNPYKIGIELFRDIEDRWNKGKFGKEYEESANLGEKRKWDKGLGLGREKIFEVRRVYNDVNFIDEFMTPEFIEKHKFYQYGRDPHTGHLRIVSRDPHRIKQTLLYQLTNMGQPFIYVADGNYCNRGELYLAHRHNGLDIEIKLAVETLRNVYKIWQRPAHLQARIDDDMILFSFAGDQPKQQTIHDDLPPPAHQ